MVDDPVRGERQDSEHLEPPEVPGGQQLEEGIEQGQLLLVVLAGLRPAEGFAERLDRLLVARVHGSHDVAGGGTVPAALHQLAGHVPVQRPPAGTADVLVDRVLDEWMGDFVDQLPAQLHLHHEPRPLELLEDDRELVEGVAGQAQQAAELDPVLDHRQDLDRGAGLAVEPSQARFDPVGEPFRQGAQGGVGQIGSLVEQGAHQSRHEQGATLSPLHQPVHQRVRYGPLDQRGSDLPHLVPRQRAHDQARQQALLLEAAHHLAGDRMGGKLGGPGDQDEEQARVDQIAGEVVQRLPRRTVAEVHVVERHDDRTSIRQAGEQVRERRQDADARRIDRGARRTERGQSRPHGRKKRGQVLGVAAAEIDHLFGGKPPQAALEGFHPQAERSRGPQRVGPRRQRHDGSLMTGDELRRQPGLPHSGLSDQQDDAQAARGDRRELGIQAVHLRVPSDEPISYRLRITHHSPPWVRAGATTAFVL